MRMTSFILAVQSRHRCTSEAHDPCQASFMRDDRIHCLMTVCDSTYNLLFLLTSQESLPYFLIRGRRGREFMEQSGCPCSLEDPCSVVAVFMSMLGIRR